jgi:hypothetical protein
MEAGNEVRLVLALVIEVVVIVFTGNLRRFN